MARSATVQIDFHKEPWLDPPRDNDTGYHSDVKIYYDCHADSDLPQRQGGHGAVDITFEFVNPSEWGPGPDGEGLHSPYVYDFAYKANGTTDWTLAVEEGGANEFKVMSRSPFKVRDVNNDGLTYDYVIWIHYSKDGDPAPQGSMGIDPKIHNPI